MWHDGGDCNSLKMDLDVLIVPNNKPSFSHISICQKYGFAIVWGELHCASSESLLHLDSAIDIYQHFIHDCQLRCFKLQYFCWSCSNNKHYIHVSFAVFNFNISVAAPVTPGVKELHGKKSEVAVGWSLNGIFNWGLREAISYNVLIRVAYGCRGWWCIDVENGGHHKFVL